ncbi:MAG: methanogenesis marker 14 protein [Candidatus Thorarchaeota archaeon]
MAKRVKVLTPRTIGVNTTRLGPFYTVASVELGNTTTKCIILSTNLRSADLFELGKEVRFTRDVRSPKQGEEVFGETLVGTQLTRESVTELVSDTLNSVLEKIGMDVQKDLHFVVRSTGVTAGFANPEDVGEMVKALADGCLKAGVSPRKMTASLSPDSLPPSLRDFTWLNKVYFDGAVASCLPPANASIVANEMEGELVTAGLKGAAKNTIIDFRNPVMTLDFGTTLAGRVTNDSYPYAKTIGSFAGLAGAIPDALVRGSGIIDQENATALDLQRSRPSSKIDVSNERIQEIHRLIHVEKVLPGTTRYGTVPVNATAAEESGVTLIGVDVGTNGSALRELEAAGADVYEELGDDGLLMVIDLVQVLLVKRIMQLAELNSLILKETSLGLTGRAITTGLKPDIIASTLTIGDGSLWTDKHQLLFVEDGLAMGAAVAARCMNSMGTKEHPMGGRKGDGCIMDARMDIQKSDGP